MYMWCGWLILKKKIVMLTSCGVTNLWEMCWCENDPGDTGSRKRKHWVENFICGIGNCK